MIYLSLIMTIFIILMVLFLFANVPTTHEVEKIKKEQEKYADEVLNLHKMMYEELVYISSVIDAKKEEVER